MYAKLESLNGLEGKDFSNKVIEMDDNIKAIIALANTLNPALYALILCDFRTDEAAKYASESFGNTLETAKEMVFRAPEDTNWVKVLMYVTSFGSNENLHRAISK